MWRGRGRDPSIRNTHARAINVTPSIAFGGWAQRCEDLPLADVRAAAGLADAELDALLLEMDDENKLMVRNGQVYLI